jgi:methyl-accepting chemotaxis protein
LSLVSLLCFLLVAQSGFDAYRAWTKREAAGAFLALDRIAELLLKSTAGWAVERGATNAALNSGDALAGEQRAAIAARRVAPDESFRAGIEALQRLADSPAVTQARNEAQNAFDKLAALRPQVDRSLAVAAAERPAELMRSWVPTVTEAIDRTNRLRLIAEIVAEPPEARLARLTQLRHLVAEMAEYAGRERAAIAGLVAAHKPIAGDALRGLSQNRGRVELAWSVVQAIRARSDVPAPLLAAITAVETQFFGAFQETRNAVFGAAETAAYPLDSRAWFEQATTAIDTLLALGRQMGAEAQAAVVATSAQSQSTLLFNLAALLVCAVLALVSVYLINRRIATPMTAMTASMRRLADGDTAVAIIGTGRGDEIGAMAQAVQVFKDNAIAVARLQDEQEALKRQAEAEKRQALEALAAGFEASVQGIVAAVSASATEMEKTAEAMSATAEETSRQATVVGGAAEEASTNVETVATASEELSSSISEISRQVAQAASIAGKAAEESKQTDETVNGLSQAAQKIGEVVALITNIASQTNLLALNATIEAARAGEAGKGFAVVASEVKSLATQTAKATDEIRGQIDTIQGETRNAVAAIQHIGGTIGEINEIATAIAAAVEEQGAATQEIARNIQQAAAGTGQVSANIGGVASAAGETGAAATQVLASAGDLALQSERLRGEVDKFLAGIRAG